MGTKHSEEEQMEANPSGAPGLKRSLSVWAAVGLSVALMAPSMAANINPQASATTAGRAVPLTFLIAAIGVLLVAYSFVRLCQYFHHSGSVYAFVGATLGPRAGVVAGWGLLGTYTFYAVVTASAAGIFGTAFLQAVGIWRTRPRGRRSSCSRSRSRWRCCWPSCRPGAARACCCPSRAPRSR